MDLAGTLRQRAEFSQQGLLLKHVGKHLLLIHSQGVATLKLSTEGNSLPEPDFRSCQGLNDSHIIAATFQQTKGNLGRYFALTSEGQILTFGPQILTSCKVDFCQML